MVRKSKKASASVEARRRKRAHTVPLVKKNPFEVRLHRMKHNVIGKKVKTDKGVPGVSRSKANEKRKKTLLKEYKQRFKANTIIDRRFGEFDDSISAEEKMLKRFTLEKQRYHEKSGLYNLDDDEEELTHYGQSLADINNFDDAGLKLTDDEEEGGDIDDHFGGFLTKKKKEPDEVAEQNLHGKKLTREEIMDQIVANSKKKKFERQQTQEHAFELTQQLDTQWKEIQPLLAKRDNRKPSDLEKPDDYDKTVNELLFEAKAKATDRLKTEGEIAGEEKKKLEELEKQRGLRMLGLTSEEDMYYQSADAIVESKKTKDNRYEVRYHDGKMIVPEGFNELLGATGKEGESDEDSANDGVEMEDDDDNDDEDKDDDNDNKEDEDDVDDSGDEDKDESDHEDLFSDEDDEESNKEDEEHVDKKDLPKLKDTNAGAKKNNKMKQQRSKFDTAKSTEHGIPFVFDAPSTLNDFLLMIQNRNQNEIILILNRIRKCHHIKLEQQNKQKLRAFFQVVMDYIDHLCDDVKPQLKLINVLAEFIQQLVEDIASYAAKVIRTKIKNIFRKITLRMKLKGESGMFPTLKELVFFKVIALIYPTSDLNHVVTTPCLFLMAMILNKAHFMCMKDVISGIFLLNIVFDYIKLSKRYLPEVITFLAKLIYLAAPIKTPLKQMSASVLNLRKSECNLLLVQEKIKSDPASINLSKCLSSSCVSTSLEDDDFRLSCVRNTYLLSKKFCYLYAELDTFHEIFEPCELLLERLPTEKFPKSMKKLHSEIVTLMTSKSEKERLPLTFQTRKPIPLPLLEPKFDENYEIRSKRRAGDKVQNEREKLKYKVKKETKGAMREIRKDAHFLAKEQLKEKLDRDATRRRKVKELQRSLENERREIREMEKNSKKGL